MGRKGFSLTFWQAAFGIATAIIAGWLLMASTGNLFSIGETVTQTTASTTAVRLGQAVELLEAAPSAAMQIGLTAAYDIEIADGEIRLSAEGMDSPFAATGFSPTFEASVEDAEATCITDSSLAKMEEGDACAPESCTDGACRGDASGGMYCDGGEWRTDGFYEQYHASSGDGCAAESGDFTTINYVQCPDRALNNPDIDVTCQVRVTYRCDIGNVDVFMELGDEEASAEFDCTDSIESETVAATRSMRAGGMQYQVAVQPPNVRSSGILRRTGEIGGYEKYASAPMYP